MNNELMTCSTSEFYQSNESVYTFNSSPVSLLCLTAKALRRLTMRGFLVGANKTDRQTLKRVQPRFPG